MTKYFIWTNDKSYQVGIDNTLPNQPTYVLFKPSNGEPYIRIKCFDDAQQAEYEGYFMCGKYNYAVEEGFNLITTDQPYFAHTGGHRFPLHEIAKTEEYPEEFRKRLQSLKQS